MNLKTNYNHIWLFLLGVILFVSIIYSLFWSNIADYARENLTPINEGWFIYFNIMLPLFFIGVIYYIFYIYDWLGCSLHLNRIKKILISNEAKPDEAKPENRKESVDKVRSELQDFVKIHSDRFFGRFPIQLINSLDMRSKEVESQTAVQDVTNSLIDNYLLKYDTYAKWMLFLVNSLIILGLLGSFLGVNYALKHLGDTRESNTIQYKEDNTNNEAFQETVSVKSDTVYKSNGIKVERFIEENKKEIALNTKNNFPDKFPIVSRMREVLAGLGITFMSSIWGIIFMLALSMTLTYSNLLKNQFVNDTNQICNDYLIYIYDPGFIGIESQIHQLTSAASLVFEIKHSIEKLYNTIGEFDDTIKNYKQESKKYLSSVKDEIKRTTDLFQENSKKFGKALTNNLKELEKFSNETINQLNNSGKSFKNSIINSGNSFAVSVNSVIADFKEFKVTMETLRHDILLEIKSFNSSVLLFEKTINKALMAISLQEKLITNLNNTVEKAKDSITQDLIIKESLIPLFSQSVTEFKKLQNEINDNYEEALSLKKELKRLIEGTSGISEVFTQHQKNMENVFKEQFDLYVKQTELSMKEQNTKFNEVAGILEDTGEKMGMIKESVLLAQVQEMRSIHDRSIASWRTMTNEVVTKLAYIGSAMEKLSNNYESLESRFNRIYDGLIDMQVGQGGKV